LFPSRREKTPRGKFVPSLISKIRVIRPDGKTIGMEIRDISDWRLTSLPSSSTVPAQFTRGQTQALVTSTIGDIKSAQSYELIGSKTSLYETFMVHYNFPSILCGGAKRQGPSW